MSVLVTAIIPTYNRADLLVRALASVAKQDYRPLEAIVIDDGSTDHTPRVLQEQEGALRRCEVSLVTHYQSNGRAPKARNTAMKRARGEYFAFLDSDDLWRPAHVRTLAELLDRYPSAGLAFSGIAVIDPDDRWVKDRPTELPPEPRTGLLPRPFEHILRYMPTQTSGVMVRRQVMDEIGDFDLDLPVVEDWDLWYRISKQYDFAYCTEPLACNREHPSNLPKYSVMALTSGLRMNLKHLPDVRDPRTRDILEARMRKQILLLQEELLRERRRDPQSLPFLRHALAPRSMRFVLGRWLLGLPRPLGRAYAGIIRWLGNRSRGQ